jgi:hypothetical protein
MMTGAEQAQANHCCHSACCSADGHGLCQFVKLTGAQQVQANPAATVHAGLSSQPQYYNILNHQAVQPPGSMISTPELPDSIKGDSGTSMQHDKDLDGLSSMADQGLAGQYQVLSSCKQHWYHLHILVPLLQQTNATQRECIPLPDTTCGPQFLTISTPNNLGNPATTQAQREP